MRLMSSFVDSELGGVGRFCRVDQLRARHQGTDRRQPHHAGKGRPCRACAGRDGRFRHRYRALSVASTTGRRGWTRDADLGTVRQGGDMRLSVFHYPITGWTDAVVMNVLMGTATGVQMTELTRVSYAPLAEVFREIAPREARHAELGLEGLDAGSPRPRPDEARDGNRLLAPARRRQLWHRRIAAVRHAQALWPAPSHQRGACWPTGTRRSTRSFDRRWT